MANRGEAPEEAPRCSCLAPDGGARRGPWHATACPSYAHEPGPVTRAAYPVRVVASVAVPHAAYAFYERAGARLGIGAADAMSRAAIQWMHGLPGTSNVDHAATLLGRAGERIL